MEFESCNFGVILRHTEHFHCRFLQSSPDISVNFVYGTKAASSEQLHGSPPRPHAGQFLIDVVEIGVVVVHVLAPCESGVSQRGQVR